MAWYRAGGGGIPSSLKTDMNDVLNKKFGTSQDYPPTDWAPTVNLMGPLPEKTASGAIVTFADGADEVPIKSWKVEIAPTLTGKSAIECTQTGTNLVALNASPQRAKIDYGITINTQTADALNITTTGVAYACERLFYSLKSGTYAVKFQATSSDSFTPIISIYRTNGTGVKFNIQPNTLTTFTLADDTDIDIRLFASGNADTTVRTIEYTYLQIEVGSTVSTYSQYVPTVSTVNLGRTIHGGSVDVVKGTGTDENGNDFTFTPITPTPETALGVNNFWADEGDSEVTYRADINLALGGQ